MSNIIKPGEDETGFTKPLYAPIKRRSFFMYAGATAGVTALALAGCNDDNNNSMPGMVDLGSGDTGILNYAYALEQLEAAFYTQVVAGTYFSSASAAEKSVFTDLRDHEVIHRELFKAALAGGAIKALTPDFSSINFADRTSVLNAAKAFEDLGVAAYNGAGRYISSDDYLTLAGKIVSVEARHAALIRDLISNGTFIGTDIINSDGLEMSKTPTEVATIANTFLADGSKVSGTNLPK
ncbi:ferritin-like domain-containing protein [Hymenobacter aerilatus]|uniref:Ferritin-like domain-containing protein n=1 Tax=Hymenobacter aerilatus TaxID=2932251 RepID=A0A8T9SWX9_9BACT|nr:ferritin-like domain-containing protein [Hymenobacter aerilatus]UOR05474.1 ferritin-like domain-containing protein [Hymenobacter aerilatus]